MKNIVFGGYEAKSCPEKTRKNYTKEYDDVTRDPIPSGDLARMESGVEFEKVIGDKWHALHPDTLFLIKAFENSSDSKKEREDATHALLENSGNINIIWNSRLRTQVSKMRTGEPDALMKFDIDGKIVWVPIDVKDHKELEGKKSDNQIITSTLEDPYTLVTLSLEGTPQKQDALQLAHYHRMLEELNLTGKPIGGIIGRSGKIIWHDLEAKTYKHPELGLVSALEYYDYEFSYRSEIAKAALAGEAIVGPELKADCASCTFRTVCHDELVMELDHITLIAGVTPDRAKPHYALGNTKIADVAKLDYFTATLVDQKIDVAALIALHSEADSSLTLEQIVSPELYSQLLDFDVKDRKDVAKLDLNTAQYSGTGVFKLHEAIDRARVMKIGRVHLARGIKEVELKRSTVEEDVDIEDYNGYVYLIGVRKIVRNIENRESSYNYTYIPFYNWDQSDEGEARIFARFWSHIKAELNFTIDKNSTYRLYHYSDHEVSTFSRLAEKYAGLPGIPSKDEVVDFFGGDYVVDLYHILGKQLIWPTESIGLKHLAKYVKFMWRDSDPGGGNSLGWYLSAVSSDEEFIREENRKRILEYNEDDVKAQVELRNWVSRLGERVVSGSKIPSVANLDKKFIKQLHSKPVSRPKRIDSVDKLIQERKNNLAHPGQLPLM